MPWIRDAAFSVFASFDSKNPAAERRASDMLKDGVVQYTAEIRCRRMDMTKTMSAIREWLDTQRFEPDAFRSITEGETVVFRLDFKVADEAQACAECFDGQTISQRFG